MKIIAASKVSNAAAVAAVFLAAGKTYDEPKSGILTAQKNTLALLWPQVEETLLKYAGKSKAKVLRDFKAWCENPPKNDKDDQNDWMYDEALSTFANRTVAQKITKDPDLSDAELQVIVSALAWARSGSNTAFLRLRKFASAVGMPAETMSLLAAKTSSQEKPIRELLALFKKAGFAATPNMRLSIEEATKLRDEKPELKAKYDSLRKELLTAYKTELQNYCRTNGGPQPIDEVRRHMQSSGFHVTSLPEGFAGLIGDDGRLYTTEGLEIDGNASVRVKMNPKYDPKLDNGYVFTYKPTPDAKDQTIYTKAWKLKKGEEKFSVANELAEKLPSIQKKYRTDLRSSKPQVRTLATMVELQYITAMRIGNVGNATKNKEGEVEPTFGLSTLQVGHVADLSGGMRIAFPGKAGVAAKYVLKPADPVLKLVIENIRKLLVDENGEKRDKKEFLFEDSTGRYNADRVNKYLRAVSGIAKITNHKIRHMRGTMAAREIIEKAPKRLDQKTAEKWFLEAMIQVGALLNHVKGVGSDQKVTPATAIKNYIDPNVSLNFFKDRGLRIPKFLAQFQKAR